MGVHRQTGYRIVLIVLVLDTAGTMTVTYIREFIYLVRLY